MCVGGSPPKAPPPPPRAPEAPRVPDVVPEGGLDEGRRRRAAAGGRDTILTSARGVQNGAATARKTLLGE